MNKIKTRSAQIFLLSLSALLAACQSIPQKDKDLFAAYHEYEGLYEKGRFSEIASRFERDIKFSHEKYSTHPDGWGFTWEFRELTRMVCDSYSRNRNISGFEACIRAYETAFRDWKTGTGKEFDEVFVKLGRADVYLFKAEHARIIGNHAEAMDFASKARQVVMQDSAVRQWGDAFDGLKFYAWAPRAFKSLSLLGLASAATGDVATTQNALDRVNAIKRDLATPIFLKAKHLAQAELHFALHQYAAASAAIEQYDNVSGAGILLGTLALMTGNPVTAMDGTSHLYREGKAAVENDDMVSQALFNIPKAYIKAKSTFELGDYSLSRKYYESLLNLAVIQDYGDIHFAILVDLGDIASAQGENGLAINRYTAAVDVLEKQRATIDADVSRIDFVRDKQLVYQKLVALLIGEGKIEQAFSYAERGKARALVDLLSSKAFSDGPGLSDSHRTLLSEIARLERQSQMLGGPDANASRTRLGSLKSKLQEEVPELASFVSVATAHPDEIRTFVGEGEAILEYFPGQDRELFAFVLTPSRLRVVTLDAGTLDDDVEALRTFIRDERSDAWKKHSSRLYRRLLAPLSASLEGSKRLTIVPHGVLHYLPFNALIDDAGRLLIEQYTIRYLPSASVARYLNKRVSATETLLALGNPDLGDQAYSLPGAEAEAKAIAGLWPGSRVYVGKEATESLVKKSAGRYRYIHLASHGEFSPGQPLKSRMLLAAGAGDDGSLTVPELYDLRLNADMVVLSACETALGGINPGDDIVGLNRGFLFAGAHSIVSSLWEVPDDATRELMVNLYTNLKRDRLSTAMQKAQMAIHLKYPHPFYWAAFQVVGGS